MQALSALDDVGRRLQAVLDNATVAVFLMDDRQHCIYMNRAAEELTGFSLAEVLARDEPLHDIIHHKYPDGRNFPLSECAIDRAFPEKHRVSGEEVFVHKDGHFYPVAFTASPIEDDASRTVGTIIEVRDITAERALEQERREAEEQLRATDLLLRSIGESSADAIYAKDREGRMIYANPATLAVVGLPAEAIIGKSESEWHHDAEEAAAIHANDQRVMASGKVERVEEVFTTPGGGTHYYRSTKAPLRDGSGAVVGIVGVTSDITEQRLAEERRQLLLGELNHRVKNTLATVQSLAFQTFRDAAPEAYRQFEGRIAALSRAHEALVRDGWSSAPVGDVVGAALAPFMIGNRLSAAGDPCRLDPKQAVSLAMILHELGTNACKYGALKGEEGSVTVRWTAADDAAESERRRLSLEWLERCPEPVTAPERSGFGTRLISYQVRREFDGTSDMRFTPGGLEARFELRVSEPPLASDSEPAAT